MAQRRRLALSTHVDELRNRLEHWRSTRQKRTRIPEELWSAATDLARAEGIHPIARALRLDYYSLKKRVAPVPAQPGNHEKQSHGFVEVDIGHAPTHEDCRIELSDGAGTNVTMTIRGSSSCDLDLKGLLSTFLDRSR